MPKYYPINEEAAKRAKDMNSFSDYQPGSATTSYRAMVDEAYAAAERHPCCGPDRLSAARGRYKPLSAPAVCEKRKQRNVSMIGGVLWTKIKAMLF